MTKKYPSGGNYPETKEDWIEHFLRLLGEASPEQLNRFTQKNLQKGGEWAKLARKIVDTDDPDKRVSGRK